MVGNGRKIGEKSDNLGQISHFSRSHFPPLFHNLATVPSSSFDEFCQPNSPPAKMGISGLIDSRQFFGQCRGLEEGCGKAVCERLQECRKRVVKGLRGLYVTGQSQEGRKGA